MIVAPLLIGMAVSAGPISSYATSLRSARATIRLRVDPQRGRALNGATVTYRVGRQSASARLTFDPNDDLAEGGFRLRDVTGIGYPLLSVVGVQCARDCEYDASFYRFDPSLRSLRPVVQYRLSASDIDCFALGAQLYAWTYRSAIPIRPVITYRYFAARLRNGSFAIVVSSDDAQGSSQAPRSVRRCSLPKPT
jgi:hypothetical protein